MTVADLIKATLQDLGVIQAGEDPTGEDADLALARFQDWVDSLAIERLTIYTITRTTWAIVSATAAYAVSLGSSRPVYVERVSYLDTSVTPNQEYPLGLLTDAQYQGIAQKDYSATLPQHAFWNPTFPTGTITLWPVPTSTTLQGVIYSPNPMSEPAALSDTLALPPGYRRFYRTNLRLELADAFEKPIARRHELVAEAAKRSVKRANVRLADLVSDPFGVGQKPNVYTGVA
jgi:hypothetical protein